MVLVSHRYKFIYLAGYKVASTSVAAFFERYCLPEDQEANHEPKCESRLITTKAGFIGPRPSEKGFTPVILEETGTQCVEGALKVPPGMDRATFANSIPPMFSHLPLSIPRISIWHSSSSSNIISSQLSEIHGMSKFRCIIILSKMVRPLKPF